MTIVHANGELFRFNLAPGTQVSIIAIGKVDQEAIRKLIQLLELSIDCFPKRDTPKEQAA